MRVDAACAWNMAPIVRCSALELDASFRFLTRCLTLLEYLTCFLFLVCSPCMSTVRASERVRSRVRGYAPLMENFHAYKCEVVLRRVALCPARHQFCSEWLESAPLDLRAKH